MSPESRERERAKDRARYAANRERRIQQTRAWKLANPEKVREQKKRWNQSEACRLERRRKYEKHCERIKAAASAYSRKYPEVGRAKQQKRRALKAAGGRFRPVHIWVLHRLQGGQCFYCETVLESVYHVDHIVPLSKDGSNWPGNLALACPQCNLSKGANDPLTWALRRER